MIPIHHCIAQSVPEYPVSPVSLYQSTNLLKSAPTYRATSFAPFSSPLCMYYLLAVCIYFYILHYAICNYVIVGPVSRQPSALTHT